MAGAGLPAAQQPITNDHIPLAFLLGSRAKHYAAPSKATFSRTKNNCSASRRSPVAKHQQRRASDIVELFAPERHPREREEEARRVLTQALMCDSHDPASTNSSSRLSSSKVPTATLSPMDVLRESKDQVLHQVLEPRQLEEADEPQHQRKAEFHVGSDAENVKSFHGFQRVDQQTSFLDVSGSASRIPVLSNLKAKEQHQSVVKKQSLARAKRVDELQRFLQSQQQHTKQQCTKQLASLANPKSRESVARVDLGIDGEVGNHRPEVPVAVIPIVKDDLTAMREKHQLDKELLRQQVHEKKLLAQLTRQQKVAFHQQQKRTLGRIKGVKRPSFLATLQLDTSAGGEDTLASGDVAGAYLFGESSNEREAKELLRHKKNQEEGEPEYESNERFLQQLQRNKFLLSKGGLHFGGGFRSNPSRKSTMPAISTTAKPTRYTYSGTMETTSQELHQLLECGAVMSTRRK